MEDFFPAIVVIIGIIGSIISSAKKEKEKKAAEEKRKAAVTARVEAAQKKQAAARSATVLPPVIANAPAQALAPTVHPHIEPDCKAHDQPGSLGVTSLEGKDPCHEAELTMERSITEAPAQAGSLAFDWTGDSMVKAVVMQEVLTRPAQRAALRQSR